MKRSLRRIASLFSILLVCAALALLFIPRARALSLRSLALVGPSAVSGWSLERLEAMGSEGAESLGLIATDARADRDLRRESLKKLSGMGARAVPATSVLAEALHRDRDPAVRYSALLGLNLLGSRGAAAIPALIHALSDEDESVAQGSSMALEAMGPAAVPALADVLNNDRERSERAAKILATLGTETAEAVPALTAALGSDEEWVRYFAALALGKIGPEAKDAESALRGCLGDSSPEVKRAAYSALISLGIDPGPRTGK